MKPRPSKRYKDIQRLILRPQSLHLILFTPNLFSATAVASGSLRKDSLGAESRAVSQQGGSGMGWFGRFPCLNCRQTVEKTNRVVQMVATDLCLCWIGSAQRSGQGESLPSPHPFGGGKPPLEHSEALASNSKKKWQSTTTSTTKTAVRLIVAPWLQPATTRTFVRCSYPWHRYLTVPGGARSASLKKDARRRLVSGQTCACMYTRPNDWRKDTQTEDDRIVLHWQSTYSYYAENMRSQGILNEIMAELAFNASSSCKSTTWRINGTSLWWRAWQDSYCATNQDTCSSSCWKDRFPRRSTWPTERPHLRTGYSSS